MKEYTYPWIFVLAGMLLVFSGCQAGTQEMEDEATMAIRVTSTAFADGETIPVKFTCDGENLSPPLTWTEVPQGTQSLVIIADDPDAPMGTFVHWVLYDLPTDQASLPEGVQGMGSQGVNGFRKSGYGGPCPPRGSTHRYYFKLYALDKGLGLKAGATKAEVEKAMQGHILAQGQLMGRFGR
jgi:Raf kinase inhibitor-like YbhB/YbcL family protein